MKKIETLHIILSVLSHVTIMHWGSANVEINTPYFFKSGIDTPDRSGQWYQHLLTVFAIFLVRAINTEGTNFQVMFVCFMFM